MVQNTSCSVLQKEQVNELYYYAYRDRRQKET